MPVHGAFRIGRSAPVGNGGQHPDPASLPLDTTADRW
jgi:hypothetical protein